MTGEKVVIDRRDKPVFVVQINRPDKRNAVDGETARLLHDAFINFAEDDEVSVFNRLSKLSSLDLTMTLTSTEWQY